LNFEGQKEAPRKKGSDIFPFEKKGDRGGKKNEQPYCRIGPVFRQREWAFLLWEKKGGTLHVRLTRGKKRNKGQKKRAVEKRGDGNARPGKEHKAYMKKGGGSVGLRRGTEKKRLMIRLRKGEPSMKRRNF